jgi:heat shock protein HslJ
MTEPDGGGPTATSDALAGTEWEIVRLADEPVHAVDQPLLLSFGHDGRVSGTTGVNQLTASYSLTADYLTFGPLATTRRSGTPEQMEQEHRLIQSLAGMCSFGLTAHTLSIEGPLGTVEAISTTPVPERHEPARSDDQVAADDEAPPADDSS